MRRPLRADPQLVPAPPRRHRHRRPASPHRPASTPVVLRHSSCPKRTFAQQIPGLTARYRRRSLRLQQLLVSVALALAGRAGARLAHSLHVSVSRTTLLRLIRALPDPPATTPRVLGVDDFALRRGHRYATLLLDMTTHRPLEVLAGRTADTLAAWLTAHSGVEIICRDRAGAYADGARTAAPQALQVADRWHLWHNLGEALDNTVRAHRACLHQPPAPTTTAQAQAPPPQRELLDSRGVPRWLLARTRQRYADVQALLVSGASLNAISRTLGMALRTVRRYADADTVEELLASTLNRSSKLDAFRPYLIQRWNQGCSNSTLLHKELQAQGWTGSLRTVQGYLRPFRAQQALPAAPVVAPKPRRIVGWIMAHPDQLESDVQVRLKGLLARCPDLDTAASHVRDFTTMMANRDGQLLTAWITAAKQLHRSWSSFADGLRRDQAAVAAGLTLPYSSGAVEGTVNRVKTITRKLFGRASFDLLRKLVLLS